MPDINNQKLKNNVSTSRYGNYKYQMYMQH